MRTCFIILFFLVFFQSCEIFYCGDISKIVVSNNSNDSILVLASINPSDTLLAESLFEYEFDNSVAPSDISYPLIDYDEVGENDSIIIFVIFSAEFINNSWKEIRQKNNISARYILKKHEIKSFKYLIIPAIRVKYDFTFVRYGFTN